MDKLQHTKIYEPSSSGIPLLLCFDTTGHINDYVLFDNQVYLGRSTGDDTSISIPSAVVSKKHGLFKNNDNVVTYTDLNSLNGTLLNDNLVDDEVKLSDGDVLTIALQKEKNFPVIKLIFTYSHSSKFSWEAINLDKSIDEILIGSSINADTDSKSVSINDAYLSSKHASFIPRGNVMYAFDFDSTNGLFVNNKRVSSSKIMNNFDIVRMGKTYGCFINGKFYLGSEGQISTRTTHPDIKQHELEAHIEKNSKDNSLDVIQNEAILKPTTEQNISEDNSVSRQQASCADKDTCKTQDENPQFKNTFSEVKRKDHKDKPVLKINIIKKVVGKGSKQKTLLKNIKTIIQPGDFVLILGGSGAGKSTFFKAVMGYNPAYGAIQYGDIDVYNDYERIKYEIGYVPQENLVRFDNTVKNTLINAAELKLPAGLSKKDYEKSALDVMKSLGLEKIADNLVGRISGGQLRRVCIGIELVGNPSLFFLDEPDSGLDEPVAQSIRKDLRKIADQGKIVLAITHSPDIEASLFTRVIVIAKCSDNSGHLLFSGSPSEAIKFFDVEKLSEIMGKINTIEENGEGLADEFYEKWKRYNGR